MTKIRSASRLEKQVLVQIRLRRLVLGYSQEYTSCMLGLSQSYYSEIERGQHSITLSLLEKISEVLQCKINDLISPTHNPILS